jgi:hypothetical protein
VKRRLPPLVREAHEQTLTLIPATVKVLEQFGFEGEQAEYGPAFAWFFTIAIRPSLPSSHS